MNNKLVLDSNIIDYCLELDLTKNFFNALNVEIWIPTYVKNEISNSKKEQLINKLSEIENKPIGFFGFRDTTNTLGFGQGIFYSQEYEAFVNATSVKHRNDRFIALLSKINNAIFITSDNKIFQDAIDYGVYAVFVTKNKKSYHKAIMHNCNAYFMSDWTEEDFEKIICENIEKRCQATLTNPIKVKAYN